MRTAGWMFAAGALACGVGCGGSDDGSQNGSTEVAASKPLTVVVEISAASCAKAASSVKDTKLSMSFAPRYVAHTGEQELTDLGFRLPAKAKVSRITRGERSVLGELDAASSELPFELSAADLSATTIEVDLSHAASRALSDREKKHVAALFAVVVYAQGSGGGRVAAQCDASP